MADPLFAIRYDTRTVLFERMPPLTGGKCPDVRNRYEGAWVYAHTKTSHAEYFVISGFMESLDEETGKKAGLYPDETGLNRCTL